MTVDGRRARVSTPVDGKRESKTNERPHKKRFFLRERTRKIQDEVGTYYFYLYVFLGFLYVLKELFSVI